MILRTGLMAAAILCLAWPAAAQVDYDKVEITVTELADGFYELEGAGGNIGVSAGEDGVLMIDSQFAPLTDKIRAAIEGITDQPVKVLMNTHHHGDHVGGNEAWADMGALIIAQENVRKHLAAAIAQPDAPFGEAALPVMTITDGMTFHWNGDTVSVSHLPRAHTDGDIMLYFHKADVLHAGDVFRTTSYPRVDSRGGGTLLGSMEALGRMIAVAGPDTKILPGHGVVSSRADVQEVLDMMVTIRDRVSKAKAEGKTLEEVQAMAPTGEFDERWSADGATGTIVTEMLYNELP